jgi:hypothetical protein
MVAFIGVSQTQLHTSVLAVLNQDTVVLVHNVIVIYSSLYDTLT